MRWMHTSRELRGPSLAAATLLLSACLPFMADQQSARMLQPSQLEITPSASFVSFSAQGETEHVQNQYGVRLGYGLTGRSELRATYERVTIVDSQGDDGLNVAGVGAKFGVLPNHLAFYFPVGLAFGGGIDSGDTWTFLPTVLATLGTSQYFELTPSAKAFVPIGGQNREVFLGFHLGAGISTNLDRWAFRPEIGMVRNPGESGVTWGWAIGFSFRPSSGPSARRSH